MMNGIQLVGGDDDVFRGLLERDDPCFGRHYAASAPECQDCVCPVVVDGRLVLLKEACRAACTGTEAGAILRLSSRQIEEMLTQGKTLYDVWVVLLNGCDPKAAGVPARQLLKDRVDYLVNNRGMPPTTTPHTKELVNQWQRQKKEPNGLWEVIYGALEGGRTLHFSVDTMRGALVIETREATDQGLDRSIRRLIPRTALRTSAIDLIAYEVEEQSRALG